MVHMTSPLDLLSIHHLAWVRSNVVAPPRGRRRKSLADADPHLHNDVAAAMRTVVARVPVKRPAAAAGLPVGLETIPSDKLTSDHIIGEGLFYPWLALT